MSVSYKQLKKKTLEVTVWDYDRYSSNDFLGEVSVYTISVIYTAYTSYGRDEHYLHKSESKYAAVIVIMVIML